jgi:15-cis-phytoene synthase
VSAVVRTAAATIAARSRSFALASRLLAPAERARAVVLYAWCRRVDDAIDGVAAAARPAALAALGSELDAIYADRGDDSLAAAMAELVARCRIPRRYPEELVAGMAMDAAGWRYETVDDLLLYCHRVAGTVGLMMSHVLGVTDDAALASAAHLGIAMQLTNIARDVDEDWRLGRLYLPDALLARHGAPDLAAALGQPLPAAALPAIAAATAELLATADGFYASGDRGIPALGARAALAVRTARLVYAAIGDTVRAQDCDPTRGRAVVPSRTKAELVARAAAAAVREWPGRARRRAAPRLPRRELVFPEDILEPA